MKRLLLLVFSTSCFVNAFAQDYLPAESRIRSTVNYLAADKLKGRGTDEKGGRKAAAWVAKQFKQLGLQPANGTSYFQDFTFDRKEHHDIPCRNVIGYLDNGAPRTIIIGAHYDHIGTAHLFDGKYPEGQIHNGADDNASGVAGLLEFIRYFVKNGQKEQFNFLFIAFGGEEMGLQGSKYYVAHPVFPLEKVHFMLNMDMIGRYNAERGLGIGGYATAEEWPAVFKGAEQPGIKFFTDGAGKGPSDHHSFYISGVPVIFLHTGPHDDYHKPTDDADKVEAKEESDILKLAIQLINNAMKYKELHYVADK